MKSLMMSVLFCISFIAFIYAQKWSFAVVADPRNDGATFMYALKEIRDITVNPEQKLNPAEFIVIAGDIDPVMSRYNDYKKIFKNDNNMKAFFPVKGNHDQGIHTQNIIKKILPKQDSIKVRDNKYVNYYVDWKNVRFIMIDQYSDFGFDGCINSKGKEWAEGLIQSAEEIDHVFICFHEPAFPRFRHIHDSFNSCRSDRDAFWKMLVKHNTKVKAVFVGHSHYYYRMRVANPKSKEALDINEYPDHEGGVYQVNCGSAGQSERNTVVRIQINGKNIHFSVVDAQDGSNKPFSLIDEWEMIDSNVTSKN